VESAVQAPGRKGPSVGAGQSQLVVARVAGTVQDRLPRLDVVPKKLYGAQREPVPFSGLRPAHEIVSSSSKKEPMAGRDLRAPKAEQARRVVVHDAYVVVTRCQTLRHGRRGDTGSGIEHRRVLRRESSHGSEDPAGKQDSPAGQPDGPSF